MPPSSCPFASAKRTVLHKLQTSVDYSPKGSIDAKAYDLVCAVNRCVEYVTTSSCSGRIALYCHDGKGGEEVVGVEGGAVDEEGVVAGGRGGSSKGSGRWLLVDHEGPVAANAVACALGEAWEGSTVVLKVEPFILHVQARDMGSAVRLLGVAIRAGYRESGIVVGSSGRGKVVVAVRSTAGGLDAPLQWAGTPIMPVWEGGVVGGALHPAFLTLIAAANERFALVESRRGRFVAEFLEECASHGVAQEAPATAPASEAPEGASALCSVCGDTFPSRNRMFKHLVEGGLEDGGGGGNKRVCPKSLLLPPHQGSKHTCRGCAVPFPSGNALFKHVGVCPAAIALKAGPAPPSSLESVEARELSRALLTRSAGGRHKLHSGDDISSELVRFLPPLGSLRRWGHCSALLPLAFPTTEGGSTTMEEREVVVVFGGCGGDGLHGRRSDAVCLLPWGGTVVGVEVEEGGEGALPAPRVRATLTPVALPPGQPCSPSAPEVALLLMGGHNGPSHVLGDAWLLRLKVVGGGGGGSGGETTSPRIVGKWTPLWTHPTSPLPSAVQPCPRFGHTCEPEGGQGGHGAGLLLFGGRSYTESFGDCWRVELKGGTGGEEEYKLSASLLYSHLAVDAYSGGAPVPRFSHASTVIPSQMGGVFLLVQGGYRSPLSPSFYATDEEESGGGIGGPSSGGGTQSQILSDFWALHVPSPTASGVITPGKWIHLRFAPLPSAASSAVIPFQRFSHTMTQLKAGPTSASVSSNSILIVGGECCDPQWNAPFVFHINDSLLSGHDTTTTTTTTTTTATITTPLPVPTQWLFKSTGLGYGVATVTPIVPLPTAGSGLTADSSGTPGLSPLLPIRHTAHASQDGSVYIIGGGGVCFAFGSMYSHSLCLEPAAFRGVLGQQQQQGWNGREGGKGVASSQPTGSCSLTLSSKVAEGVKKELQACGWYDWSRKVGQVTVVGGGEKALGVPITVEGYERLLLSSSHQEGSPPLPPSLLHAIALPSTLLSNHCPLLPQFSPQANDGGPASMLRASSAVHDLLESPQGRLWLASSGVSTLTHELCEVGGQGDKGFPSKVEWLSDILVLPSHSFTSPSWTALLRGAGGGLEGSAAPPASSSSSSSSSSSPFPALLWDTLAGVFHTERVGKGGEVSPGGTRESGMRMLRAPPPPPGSYSLPPAKCLGQGGEVGGVGGEVAQGGGGGSSTLLPHPSSIPVGYGGWVEVKEGGLTYTFDATRVMFSSGNVTEKARMGGLPVEGETIVDLYAGIGYFTLPLLAKGKAGRVHAVEWNTDALACLAINVGRVGGFEGGGRVSLWPGDNTTLLTRHPHLRACADRVLLGLIPSSVPGWPTALGVLKPEGGMLHVHENVREGEAEEWARGTLIPELARLAGEAGSKAWTFTLEHIERVKGYAPRVAHFVFDVRVRR